MEKISVPSSLNIYSTETSSPKLDNNTRAQHNVINNNSNSNSKNPFINSDAVPASSSPVASTNPFLRTTSEDSAQDADNSNGRQVVVTSNGSNATKNNGDVAMDKKNPFRNREIGAELVAAAKKAINLSVKEKASNENKEEMVTISGTDGGGGGGVEKGTESNKVSASRVFKCANPIHLFVVLSECLF